MEGTRTPVADMLASIRAITAQIQGQADAAASVTPPLGLGGVVGGQGGGLLFRSSSELYRSPSDGAWGAASPTGRAAVEEGEFFHHLLARCTAAARVPAPPCLPTPPSRDAAGEAPSVARSLSFGEGGGDAVASASGSGDGRGWPIDAAAYVAHVLAAESEAAQRWTGETPLLAAVDDLVRLVAAAPQVVAYRGGAAADTAAAATLFATQALASLWPAAAPSLPSAIVSALRRLPGLATLSPPLHAAIVASLRSRQAGAPPTTPQPSAPVHSGSATAPPGSGGAGDGDVRELEDLRAIALASTAAPCSGGAGGDAGGTRPADLSMPFNFESESHAFARNRGDIEAAAARERARDALLAVVREYRDIGTSFSTLPLPAFLAGLPVRLRDLRTALVTGGAASAPWFARHLLHELTLFALHECASAGAADVRLLAGGGDAARLEALASRMGPSRSALPPPTAPPTLLPRSPPPHDGTPAAAAAVAAAVAPAAGTAALPAGARGSQRRGAGGGGGARDSPSAPVTPAAALAAADEVDAAPGRGGGGPLSTAAPHLKAASAWAKPLFPVHPSSAPAAAAPVPATATAASAEPSNSTAAATATAAAAAAAAAATSSRALPLPPRLAPRSTGAASGPAIGSSKARGSPDADAGGTPMSGTSTAAAAAAAAVAAAAAAAAAAAGGGGGRSSGASPGRAAVAAGIALPPTERFFALLVYHLELPAVSAAVVHECVRQLASCSDAAAVRGRLASHGVRSLYPQSRQAAAVARLLTFCTYAPVVDELGSAYPADVAAAGEAAAYLSLPLPCGSILARAADNGCLTAVLPWVVTAAETAAALLAPRPPPSLAGMQAMLQPALAAASAALLAPAPSASSARVTLGPLPRLLIRLLCRRMRAMMPASGGMPAALLPPVASDGTDTPPGGGGGGVSFDADPAAFGFRMLCDAYPGLQGIAAACSRARPRLRAILAAHTPPAPAACPQPHVSPSASPPPLPARSSDTGEPGGAASQGGAVTPPRSSPSSTAVVGSGGARRRGATGDGSARKIVPTLVPGGDVRSGAGGLDGAAAASGAAALAAPPFLEALRAAWFRQHPHIGALVDATTHAMATACRQSAHTAPTSLGGARPAIVVAGLGAHARAALLHALCVPPGHPPVPDAVWRLRTVAESAAVVVMERLSDAGIVDAALTPTTPT